MPQISTGLILHHRSSRYKRDSMVSREGVLPKETITLRILQWPTMFVWQNNRSVNQAFSQAQPNPGCRSTSSNAPKHLFRNYDTRPPTPLLRLLAAPEIAVICLQRETDRWCLASSDGDTAVFGPCIYVYGFGLCRDPWRLDKQPSRRLRLPVRFSREAGDIRLRRECAPKPAGAVRKKELWVVAGQLLSSRPRLPLVLVGPFFSRPRTLRRPPLPRRPLLRPLPSRPRRCPQQITCSRVGGRHASLCRGAQGYRLVTCTATSSCLQRERDQKSKTSLMYVSAPKRWWWWCL